MAINVDLLAEFQAGLEDLVHVPTVLTPHCTGQELIDACAKVRGLLTDEEVDTLFSRNASIGRPVDFE